MSEPTLADKLAEHGIRLKSYTPGSQVTTCPKCSPSRRKKTDPCLSVKIDDDGVGAVWHCNHCNDFSGNVPGSGGRVQSLAQKPIRRPKEPTGPWRPVQMYAWFEKRGISREVVDAMEIRMERAIWFPQVDAERPAVAFPYRRRGELVNHKYRMAAEKHFRQDKDAERTLYNIDSLAEADECIWVEGEMDVLAMLTAGYRQVVSLPDGAPPPPKPGERQTTEEELARKHDRRLSALSLDVDRLLKIKRHYIGTDMDAPGEALAHELARRLGPERCWRIRWRGGKDANDVLMAGGAEAVHGCYRDARPWPISGLHDLETSSLIDLRSRKTERLYSTGWGELDRVFRLSLGWLWVITGLPGAGKSEFIDALIVNKAETEGHQFAIYSAENPMDVHAAKLLEKHARRPFRNYGPNFPQPMTDAEVLEGERWIMRHFHFIRHDQDEPVTIEFILEKAEIAVARHGIRGLVIDPYNEIDHRRGRDQTETEYVSHVLGLTRRFARRHECNVYFVAHPKTPSVTSNKAWIPGPYDISGGAHWRNKADIGLTVDLPDDHVPKTDLWVWKVRFRHWGKRGSATLWWDDTTGRYYDSEEDMQNAKTQGFRDANLV